MCLVILVDNTHYMVIMKRVKQNNLQSTMHDSRGMYMKLVPVDFKDKSNT